MATDTPAGNSSPVSGRRGRFQVNGANANVEEWTVDESTDILPATGFEDQNIITGRTRQRVIDGIDKLTFTVKGYIDVLNMPSGTYGFYAGSDLTAVKLYIDKSVGARCWAITAAKVKSVNYSNKLNGRAEFSLTCESNGDYTAPA